RGHSRTPAPKLFAYWEDQHRPLSRAAAGLKQITKGEMRMTNNTLAKFAGVLLTSVAAAALAPAYAADAVLSGAITSPSGEKLGGVTVSAKQAGSTITNSVYTDETGNYYFPPLATGKYQVWAQALSFATAKGDVDLSAAKQQKLVLQPLTDAEARWRQLLGELMVASLPEAPTDGAR